MLPQVELVNVAVRVHPSGYMVSTSMRPFVEKISFSVQEDRSQSVPSSDMVAPGVRAAKKASFSPALTAATNAATAGSVS